jgi:hypothetical protein
MLSVGQEQSRRTRDADRDCDCDCDCAVDWTGFSVLIFVARRALTARRRRWPPPPSSPELPLQESKLLARRKNVFLVKHGGTGGNALPRSIACAPDTLLLNAPKFSFTTLSSPLVAVLGLLQFGKSSWSSA